MKKKLLITGASGFLGWNVCRAAREEWEVFGVAFSHPVEAPGVRMIRADLADFAALTKLFEEIRPDAVIHAAAATQPNYCQLHPEETRRINVGASISIAGLCADRSLPCAFTSTDLVFDGLHAPYREEDPVSPVSIYGEHKALAEKEMLLRYPRLAVCRMPLMFGDPGPAASSFIQPMIEASKAGRELKLFTDEFRTPIGGRVAAQGLLMALGSVSGVIHLGGMERISRYGFGKLLVDVWGLGKAHLTPCSQKDVEMAAPRPPDVSLNSEKAFRMGFHPHPLRAQLEELLRELPHA